MILLTAALLLFGATPALAQSVEELRRLTLAELMKIEVSTVTRVPETIVRIPAAVFIITADDIRRAGATSIPEALALAPGMQVARIDSARWSIGMRGFPDRLARAMLVLIDGRAVYSPLFAGTYWEVQDTMLEDIERIEVIRGPGGTLWGANAVTGIINIVTKSSKTTDGLLVSGGTGGPIERGFGGIRFGDSFGDSGAYRAYVKATHRGPQFRAGGTSDVDDWTMVQGGFRSDWGDLANRAFTLQGDTYRATLGQRVPLVSYEPPFSQTILREAPLTGANVLFRWTEALNAQTRLQVQSYYDRTSRDEIPVAETRNTFDVDAQVTDRRWPRHAITWGAGFRVTSDDIRPVGLSEFSPRARTDGLFSAFAQDEFELRPGRLNATFGVKFEHNEYSGAEWQPSARLAWTPSRLHTFIASATRAVRTPSRVETDYSTVGLANPAIPAFIRLQPNPAFVPEEVVAYEIGYRFSPALPLYLTWSGFYNQHDNTLSTDLLTPFVEAGGPGPERLILPVTFANGLHGRSYGAETTADWRMFPWWRLTANHSFIRIEMTKDPGGLDISQELRYERQTPYHQVQLQSSFDLPRNFTLDWLLRYASDLRAGGIDAFATSNLRLGWQVSPRLEVAVVGRDLHDSPHAEWIGSQFQVRRSGFVQVVYRR